MQQQQQPTCIRFPAPFAHVPHNPFTHATTTPQQRLAVNFSGTWIKDKAASDSMSEAISLMGLSGIMRQAIKLIKGVKITQDDASFSMAVFSVFTWFKVSERFALDGSVSKCRRRDFRRGGHRGHVSAPHKDKMLLHLEWDAPFGGVGVDEFSMPNPDVLHIASSITVDGKTCAGPHCLTTLLRLLEPDADTSIDLAQRKTTPKAQVLKYWHRQRTNTTYRQTTSTWLREKVAVVDPSGNWLVRWQQQFTGLQICHLRSSSAVHPDPLDTYAFVTYAGSQGRMAETQPLNHIQKTQDFHGPFHTPGAALFEDFCQDLIYRYCLQDLVTQDEVVNLTPMYAAVDPYSSIKGTISTCSSSDDKVSKPLPAVDHWRVDLASGQQLTARKVIVGIGSTNRQRVPAALQQLQPALPNPHLNSSSSDLGGTCGSASSDNTSSSSHMRVSSSSGWSSSSSASSGSLIPDSPDQSSHESSDCGFNSCNDVSDPDCQQAEQSDAEQQAAKESTCQLPAAGTYPWGRMMHAWELVKAAAAAAAVEAGCGTRTAGAVTTADVPTISSSHSASSSSSSGNIDGSAGFKAQQSSLPVLQQLGLLLPGESVVIIGGGLTSAHLAQLAFSQVATATTTSSSRIARQRASKLASSSAANTTAAAATSQPGPQAHQAVRLSGQQVSGQPHVTLLMRSEWCVKQFDVDIPYMGRLRAKQLADFRQLRSFDQRLALIREVLQGGSMPPEAAAGLQQLQQAGQLTVQQHTNVVAAEWDWQENHWEIWLEDGSILHAHRLWLATGSHVDVSSEPLFKPLLQQLPIPVVSGLPAIQPSLEWCSGSGMYVLGAYAALQLGPGALNLAGAKTASVMMAKQLKQQLQLELPGHQTGSSRSGSSSSAVCSSNRSSAGGGSSSSSTQAAVDQQLVESGQGAAEALDGATSSSSSSSSRPCTALRGVDTLCLAGVVSAAGSKHHQHNREGPAGPHTHSQQQQCCGSCWKSRHLVGRSRWGGGARR